ncbi:MAG: hypothetical protein IKE91_02295 [Clostridia bacterium]|nr:hypothetical protein [Clostridia bacterium]
MENNKDYKVIAKMLSIALIDDFRGFLVEGIKAVEVPDDRLHAEVALKEMMKIPGWHHESGVGEDPIVELMKEKNAIYISQIPIPNKPGKYTRIVSFIKDKYRDKVLYKGENKEAREMLIDIATGMGYTVDEYRLLPRKETGVKTPVDVERHTGKVVIKSRKLDVEPPRSIKEGDKPKFDRAGNFIGFISGGKFINKDHYPRYNKSMNRDLPQRITNVGLKIPQKEDAKKTKKSGNEEQGDR